MGPRADLDAAARRKNCSPNDNRTPVTEPLASYFIHEKNTKREIENTRKLKITGKKIGKYASKIYIMK
jgi:hypothetical protein